MKLKEKEVKIEDNYIRWFSDVGKEDVKEVGGKAANLGEMLKIGIPVPPGFVVNAKGYEYFLEETGLKEKIYEKLKIDVEDTDLLEKVAKEVRGMIIEKEMPEDLKEEILEAYEILGTGEIPETASEDVSRILKMSEPEFVAVRSSATAEDTKEASFAGQQETFLNIKGKTELIESVKKCFASLFTSRSIYYRVKKGFKHEDVLNAVIVQKMISSDKSGVIFSQDPVTKEENVVIEAVFGLGEGVVSGKIKPDYYLISRDLKILKKDIADKKIAITRTSAGKAEQIRLSEDRSKQQVLNNSEIKKLADYALDLEKHYNMPQDIEFAVSSKEIFIVQTRPITTLEREVKEERIEGKELLSGLAASPGIGSGEVKIVRGFKDLAKIAKGNVLVTKMTNPDMVVTMQKSSAIITDEGGMTAHAAIVSREMGIVCVVGTKNATSVLKDGQIVTVDGFKGKVYLGKIEKLKKQGLKIEQEKVEVLPVIETETKIKIMVDLPSFAERASKTGVREVGLTRIEGIIAERGKHPLGFLNEGKIDEYEELIFSGIQKIGKYFDELWIRTSDIRSDEFKNLEGAPKEVEANPMLGMHGIRDGLKNKEILKAELRAVSRVSGEDKRIGILLPQVISVQEVRDVKNILGELNIENLKLGAMIETPASVEIIEELCKEIEFISFGTNDLTQYTLAVDRGNVSVQEFYDEMHPAILSQMERVIKICKKNNVETSICGQAGSKKEMVEFLVKLGIDSISVNADKAREISKFVKDLEDRGLRGNEFRVEGKEESREERREDKRKTYPIICDECGKEGKVPFKPKPNRSVYCKDCFRKIKKSKDLKEESYERGEKKMARKQQEAKEEKKKEEEETTEKEETKEEVEEKEKPEKEWQDLDFGIDVFSSQQKPEEKEEKPAEEEKEAKEEKKKEETLDIF